jgi:hypothetical protein
MAFKALAVLDRAAGVYFLHEKEAEGKNKKYYAH